MLRTKRSGARSVSQPGSVEAMATTSAAPSGTFKIGGDLDNKKARSEKEALLEQYAILRNALGPDQQVFIRFATAYNRFGEGAAWKQERVRQFFADAELLIGCDFWNFVCKSDDGYALVLDEYKKNAPLIIDALNNIKGVYLEN